MGRIADQRNPDERLIIFTRYPRAGHTKTRLIPALGPKGAADLQRQMTQHALAAAREARARRSLAIEIGFTGGGEADMARWLGRDLTYHPQARGDIGRRMASAFVRTFRQPVRRAVLMGSDTPGITPAIIAAALDGLRNTDLVLGPARDGGYYLIGLGAAGAPKLLPGIFTDIPWSTDQVLSATLEKARRAGVEPSCLKVLEDVDRPGDLAVWERYRRASG